MERARRAMGVERRVVGRGMVGWLVGWLVGWGGGLVSEWELRRRKEGR